MLVYFRNDLVHNSKLEQFDLHRAEMELEQMRKLQGYIMSVFDI